MKPLSNLKSIDLSWSRKLTEFPNLSKATNLETLRISECKNLVELPSSISNLHKLKELYMGWCEKLEVIPANINLASLEVVDMRYCSRLRSFPNISTDIKRLGVSHTGIEDVPSSIIGMSRLESLEIAGRSLKRLTHVPLSITALDLSNSDIKMIPDSVKSLPLQHLLVVNCSKLMSIPDLSPSLEYLNANDCVSLERVYCFQKTTKIMFQTFYNCLKLDEESRRRIIQQSVYEYTCLPAKEIPAEFTHRTTGNSVTIPMTPGTFSASSRSKVCLLLSQDMSFDHQVTSCNLRSKGGHTNHTYTSVRLSDVSPRSEHLFIFHGNLSTKRKANRCHATMSEITFKFSCSDNDEKMIECGVRIMTEEAESSEQQKGTNKS